MKISLLGPPGAGKGTQARKVAQARGVPQISTGDMLRQAVADREPVGLKAKEFMDKGSLVPDGVILDLVRARLAKPDAAKGFLLDGFPRTIPQADGLAKFAALDAVIYVAVAEAALVERLSGRRTCPNAKCNAMYHVKFTPPKKAGVCDACGTALVQRTDDAEGAVRQRLKVYDQQTAPLIQYYEKRNLLRKVDGGRDPETVARDLLAALPE